MGENGQVTAQNTNNEGGAQQYQKTCNQKKRQGAIAWREAPQGSKASTWKSNVERSNI